MRCPRVSILMPIYNVEKYIHEAINSILNQTYTDFELICLDDCSPDNSASILDSYDDPRIVRYRGERNVGLANILNIGMMMARGEFIARMDSDDISLPERLQVQVDYLDSHPEIDLVSTGMEIFGDQHFFAQLPSSIEDIKVTAIFHAPVMHASSMWRKVKMLNMQFDQSEVPAEDYGIWTRCLSKGIILSNIPQPLYRYRFHCANATKNKLLSAQKSTEVRQRYLQRVLPSLKDVNLLTIFDQKNYPPIKLKQICQNILQANLVDKYFCQEKLEHQLLSYYRSTAFAYQKKHGIKKDLFFDLRISQMFKLLFYRLKP